MGSPQEILRTMHSQIGKECQEFAGEVLHLDGLFGRRILDTLDYEEMTNLPDRDWLVPELLLEEQSALIHGQVAAATRKSAVALAATVAAGQPLGKFVTRRPRRVLLVAGGGMVEPILNHLRGGEDCTQPVLLGRPLDLAERDHVSDLIGIVRDWRIDLIVAEAGTRTSGRLWMQGANRLIWKTRAAVLTVSAGKLDPELRSADSWLRAEAQAGGGVNVTVERHRDHPSAGVTIELGGGE